MSRLTDMMMVYFVSGALMWATGMLTWEDTGIVTFFLNLTGGDIEGANAVETNLTNMGGPIGNIVNTLGGGLLAIWQFIENLVQFSVWPVTILVQNNAPPEVVALVGGPVVVGFVGGFILLVRGSA